ncbi:hypothetical protein CEXT_318071 [Caerostris extrusa]|uniref:Uncharacterized protein n=1 Tax=Caerostris extrusa TaxID=172846 RepID=A0AAV4PMD2_CAEEX|nr:hypothetical protein CEXT_318071 [Caerostris extrusa]
MVSTARGTTRQRLSPAARPHFLLPPPWLSTCLRQSSTGHNYSGAHPWHTVLMGGGQGPPGVLMSQASVFTFTPFPKILLLTCLNSI